MKGFLFLVLTIMLLVGACSPRISSYKSGYTDALWHDDFGYRLPDSTYCIYYVDSIPCPPKYYMLYSDKTRYTYFSVDSIDARSLKESDILVNNIANLLVDRISTVFSYYHNGQYVKQSGHAELFGSDDMNNSKLKLEKVNQHGIGKCSFERHPSYFRILLIRGDYLENNLHYFHTDGRYKWPLQVMDWSAYYKVYVPIWE